MSNQKVAVVTGGNKGIGYAIVKGLCQKFDGVVYLTARDPDKGQAAIHDLQQLGLDPKFHQLDITDQASVDRLKNYLKTTHGGLDLLINNAGVLIDHRKPLQEQAEKTLAVNYFGTLKICEALFPILRNNAKVVNVSSALGHLSYIPSMELREKFKKPTLTISELNTMMQKFLNDAKNERVTENGWGNTEYTVYAVSKVAVTALTMVQQKQFDNEKPNRNISVNAVHPGYVDTDLTNHQGVLTPDQGAKAPLWLALEANVKGKYVWSNSKVVPWDSATIPTTD